jgi:hypothetical protein
MDRLRSILLIVLMLALVAAVLLGIVRDPATLIGGVFAVLLAVIGIPEIWNPFRLLDGKRLRKGEPNESDYLHGRLEVFQREEELFVRLAGETPIQSRFESFAAETFNAHIPGEKVKTYDDIAGAVDDYHQFIIVGDPGAGKSTTLRHIAAQAMERRLDSTAHPLPLWINLGSSANPPDAHELIGYWWDYHGIPGDPQTMLNNNRVWLFLDGLNEMPEQKASREQRAQSIKALLHQYPDMRAVVTCRVQDYDDNLRLDLPVMQIKALQREQIQAFIALRLGAESDLLAKIDAADYLQRMASNPYQLVLLIDIYRETKQLPTDLNDLYRLYFEARFESDAGRRLLKLSQGQLRRKLEQLAFRMIAAGKGTAADARWTQRQIGRKALRAGLNLQLLVQDKNVIRFYHQSLHSYFAFPLLKRALQNHWLDRWRTRRRVRFIEGIGNLREAAAPAVPVLIEALRDSNWNVRQEAILALGRIGASAVPALIELLPDADVNVRLATGEVFGYIGAEATPAVPALTKALHDDSQWVRLQAAKALKRIGSPVTSVMPTLMDALHVPDEYVRAVAALEMGNMGVDAASVVPVLIDMLRTNVVGRWSAAWALGNIGVDAAPAVPALSERLHDSDAGVRNIAAEALEKIGTPEALAALDARRQSQQKGGDDNHE